MKKLYKTIFIAMSCSCIFSYKAVAQDPHFSQYFSSPLTINPALTGYFDGEQRFTVNLRSQTNGNGDPYTTGTASFDSKILTNRIAGNDKWGFGVHALYDQSSGGIYKNTYLSVSTAFNKGLDQAGNQSIGIGVQASIARNNVDFSKVSFSNQFTGSGFDLSVPNGETVNNQSVSYVDLNAGVLYNYKDENGNQFSLGASIYHILAPKLSFFSGNNSSLQQRYTVHAGAGFAVGETDNFFVSAYLMQQNSAVEKVIGGAYGLGLGSSDYNLYLGAWMRVKDAVYPYISLRAPEYQIGLSYDITNTNQSGTKKFSGSTELSFIYFFNRGDRQKGIPCFF